MNKDVMLVELTRDEGMRQWVYDDATGKNLRAGMSIAGHPTVGVGRALDTRGLTQNEQLYLLSNDIDAFDLGLTQRFTWYANLDDVRQRVLLNMAFNMGIDGVTKFADMIRYIEEQRWDLAASAMEDSIWYRQVGQRAVRLADMMRTGYTT